MNMDEAIESLIAYRDQGRPTGDFLCAVLSNDLMDAFGRADEETIHNMRGICAWVYNNMPMSICGSRENVVSWLKHKAQERNALMRAEESKEPTQ